MVKRFTLSADSCYIACKPRGPVLENTIPAEVAAPTIKRGFVTSKFFGTVRSCVLLQLFKGGMGISVRTAARLLACFQHPVHLMRLKTQTVVSFGSPAGIQTMIAITALKKAPKPNSGTPDPIQLHADARNALSMAVFYLSQPQANVAGARRKAVQALSALRGLDLRLEG